MFVHSISAVVLTVVCCCAPGAVAQDPVPQPDPVDPAAGIPECADMKKTASGLEFGVLSPGRGEAGPGPDDMVKVHYTGWLLDGTKFDSSRDRGQPASFGVGQVIKGWTEGLQLMTPGARYKLVIPAELAYGANQAGQIPPNSTLVFDVELLEVVRMPEFPPELDGDAELVGEENVKYQVLDPGKGEACGEHDGLSLRYAIWRMPAAADGEGAVPSLLDCSERQNGHRISGIPANLPFPWMQKLGRKLKDGMKVRLQVPQKAFPNAGADTVWTLELTGVSKVPKFRKLDPAKTVTTDSGLVYEVIEQGDGNSPKATDTVTVMYSGWLEDGTMFDSSHARGSPTQFPLNRVIKGWTEGVQLMGVGGKYLFRIPGDLAYGKEGSPPRIPANATLVFLIELQAIE